MKTIFQKATIVLCVLVLVFGTMPGIVMSAAWDSRTGISVNLRVGVMADAHVTQVSADRVNTAMLAYKAIDPDIDGLAFVGDMVYQTGDVADQTPATVEEAAVYFTPEHYDNLLAPVNSAFPLSSNTKRIFTMGNHEFPTNGTNANIAQYGKELFEAKTGQAPNYSTEINGYTFIAASPESYANVLGTATEDWVKSEIDTAVAANPNKPIFLLMHQPIHQTVLGSVSSAQHYSDSFKTYLNSKPQVIHFTAHHHRPSMDPRTIWQDTGFTSVQVPLLGGGYLNLSVTNDWGNISETSESLLLEVDSNDIVRIYKMNLVTGQYIGEPFVIDVPGIVMQTAQLNYTNARAALSTGPVFPVNAEISADNLTSVSAKITFTVAEKTTESAFGLQDGFVQGYRIEVTNDSAQAVVQDFKVSGDFWKTVPGVTRTVTLSKLSRNTAYTVKVYPLTAFQAEGSPLTLSFSTTDEKSDAERALTVNRYVNVALNKPITSSAISVYPASNLVDGKRGNSSFVANGTSYTGVWGGVNHSTNWWMVDLQKRYDIDKIVLYARPNQYSVNARRHFQFEGSNNGDFSDPANYDVLGGMKAGNDAIFPHGGSFTLDLSEVNAVYRYIRLKRTDPYGPEYVQNEYSELKIYANVTATEVSRNKPAVANFTNPPTYVASKAVNGTNSSSTDCWYAQNSGVRNFLRVDLQKQYPIGLIEMEAQNTSADNPNARQGWRIYGSNSVIADDSILTNNPAIPNPESHGYKELFYTWYNGDGAHILSGEYFFPKYSAGKFSEIVDDSTPYRYITFKQDGILTAILGQVRAFVLNPMLNKMEIDGNRIILSFNEIMDFQTINTDNVKFSDVALGTPINLSNFELLDEGYDIAFTADYIPEDYRLELSENILDARGVDLGRNIELLTEIDDLYSGLPYKTVLADVAQNKPVTGTTPTDGALSRLTDGEIRLGSTNSGGAIGNYFTVDLQKRYKLEKVEIYDIFTGTVSVPTDTYPAARGGFEIQASLTGDFANPENYDVLGGMETADEMVFPNNGKFTLELDGSKEYRYVKLVRTSAGKYGYSEIKVFANQTVTEVTRNKPVIASYYHNSPTLQLPPENAVDGDPSTDWVADSILNNTPEGDDYHYLSLDLGRPYPLGRIEMSGRQTSGNQTSNQHIEMLGSNIRSVYDLTYTNPLTSAMGYYLLTYIEHNDGYATTGQPFPYPARPENGIFAESFSDSGAYRYLTFRQNYHSINAEIGELRGYVINPVVNSAYMDGDTVYINFDEQMKPDSLNGDNIKLYNVETGMAVDCSGFTADGYGVSFTADIGSGLNKKYRLEVSRMVKNRYDVTMAEDYVQEINTVMVIDPTVVVEGQKVKVSSSWKNTTASSKVITIIYACRQSDGTLFEVSANQTAVAGGKDGEGTFTVTFDLSSSGDYSDIFIWDIETLCPYYDKLPVTEVS